MLIALQKNSSQKYTTTVVYTWNILLHLGPHFTHFISFRSACIARADQNSLVNRLKNCSQMNSFHMTPLEILKRVSVRAVFGGVTYTLWLLLWFITVHTHTHKFKWFIEVLAGCLGHGKKQKQACRHDLTYYDIIYENTHRSHVIV